MRGHFLSLVVATAAMAVAPAQAQTLDFAAAYRAALSQDARLRAARHAADVGREAVPQAEALLRPNLSVGISRSKNALITSTDTPSGAGYATHEAYYAGNKSLTLRQPLYRPAMTANLDQARAKVDEAEATLERETQTLALRVAEAYFELLLADDQIALVEAQKRSYTTQLDAAQKSFAAGSGMRTDIDEVRARLDLAEAQALEARQHRLLAHRQLQAMVTERFDRIAPIAPASLTLAGPAIDLDAWLAKAEAQSPEIRAAQAQLDAARFEIEKARAGHKPTLDVVGEWGRSSSDNINRIGSRSTTKMLGLQLNLPLYAGGATQSAVRQTLAEEQRASEQLQALRSDLGIRVYREYAGVSEGVLRVRALEQAVRSSEQVVLSNQKSFQAGSRTTVDVLNAEQQRVSALRDLAQARYLYLMSQVRLSVLAGDFNEQRLGEIGKNFVAAAAPAPAPVALLSSAAVSVPVPVSVLVFPTPQRATPSGAAAAITP